jgi:hypothetical protein
VSRRGKGPSKLEYQIHRGIDRKCEIITATEITPGEVHEAHRLQALIDSHEKNTSAAVEVGIQNIMSLLANIKAPAAGAKIQTQYKYHKAYIALQNQFFYFKEQITGKVSLLFGFKAAAITI